MLAQTARSRQALARALAPAAAAGGTWAAAAAAGAVVVEGTQLQQARGMVRLFEVFSKEARLERKKKLKEEIDRGYFDDFRDFRDKQGKVFFGEERLIPASQAVRFPVMHALLPDSRAATFPPRAPTTSSSSADASNSSSSSSSSTSCGGGGASSSAAVLPHAQAALVCIAFRAGPQEMLEAWAAHFATHFKGRGGAALYELSLVEGVVMGLWPFRRMLLKVAAQQAGKYALPVQHLFHFGNTDELRELLHMTNRLTGYVYLLDGQGRVRWRGSGPPQPQELAALVRCGEELLQA